jgi:hypothetical protein
VGAGGGEDDHLSHGDSHSSYQGVGSPHAGPTSGTHAALLASFGAHCVLLDSPGSDVVGIEDLDGTEGGCGP